MPKFDPYEASARLPKPAGIVSVAFDGTTDEHVMELPRPGLRVANRIVFLEISGGTGTRKVTCAARTKTVRFVFPVNVRVAAFIVDETECGERSGAGPVHYFRAVRKAPPRPSRPSLKRLEEVA